MGHRGQQPARRSCTQRSVLAHISATLVFCQTPPRVLAMSAAAAAAPHSSADAAEERAKANLSQFLPLGQTTRTHARCRRDESWRESTLAATDAAIAAQTEQRRVHHPTCIATVSGPHSPSRLPLRLGLLAARSAAPRLLVCAAAQSSWISASALVCGSFSKATRRSRESSKGTTITSTWCSRMSRNSQDDTAHASQAAAAANGSKQRSRNRSRSEHRVREAMIDRRKRACRRTIKPIDSAGAAVRSHLSAPLLLLLLLSLCCW